ncbi:DUF4238 domain-containing protein [Actibacterium ureilyticum]|uniref:DUF4238 domain-containing protein n=1 Tax=Actibacterium ureilyticum TaxID=1590614 RepID=UPI000BAAA3CE|nr:DUF4238 domain-containing protein [Actibacterium ureilyticum]
MSKRSKNHHYVPKVLQKQFWAHDEHVWYSEKDESGQYCAPYLKHVDKTFFIKNYYTVLDGDELSDVVEKKFYGSIDNYLGEIFPQIMGIFEAGSVPEFEGEALPSLINVIVEMIKRTPEFTRRYEDLAIGREVALDVLNQDESDERKQAMLALLQNESKLKELGRTVRVRATIDISDRMASILDGFSLRWAISETNHSYLLSSRIGYQIGNGGPNGLQNHNAEIWMPVSPKHALVLLRDPANRIPPKHVVSPMQMRKINEYAARNSNQIASHSQRLIESIVRKRAVLR